MSGPIPGGLLIAVEGIDGAGKTTMANALGARLRELGHAATVTKEPTAGPWGMRLRESASKGRLTVAEELELFRRDRMEHIEDLIAPALARDEVVILDRYYYSTAAYQGAAGANVADVMADSESFAPRPHVAFLIDVPVDVGIDRILARGDRPNSFETVRTLETCRHIFLSLDGPEIQRVDGTASIKDVLEFCWSRVLAASAVAAREKLGFTPDAAKAVLLFGAG